jgi:TonB family protein
LHPIIYLDPPRLCFHHGPHLHKIDLDSQLALVALKKSSFMWHRDSVNRSLMQKNVLLSLIVSLLLSGSFSAYGAMHPATVGQGPDSFAMQLHYPPQEKAAKEQGAVKFYCEVSPEGKPAHITTLYGKGEARFGKALEFALHHGRFNPATVDGKPVTVMLGGSVLFLMSGGQPTIAITLATAENDKIAKMANYQQPQMLDSDALFRRKVFANRDRYNLRYGTHLSAVVVVHVDAQGNLVSKSIASESPPNGGHGRLLLDVMDKEHFIPAQSNGQPIAGDFELAVDFEHMRNPDRGPDIGTLIKRDTD